MVVLVLAASSASFSQPSTKVPRVGLLASEPGAGSDVHFRQGLRELGWIDGRNIRIEARFARGRSEQYAPLVAELVRIGVDVIVTTGGEPAAQAAKRATSTVPIVVGVLSPDPVASGLVRSIAKPGGNLTGFVHQTYELVGKRLELMKETLPHVKRVGVLSESAVPGPGYSSVLDQAARTLGLQIRLVSADHTQGFEAAFGTLAAERTEAVMTIPSARLWVERARIVALAARHRLPAIYPEPDFAEAGGLMTYGPLAADNFRRAAGYVDRILKGAVPADLPVEFPRKFEIVVNLKAARGLGLTVPATMLARADRVIQ